MKVKKITLNGNLKVDKPPKPTNSRKMEYLLTSDYLVSIREEFGPNSLIPEIPKTLDHKITIDNPIHLSEMNFNNDAKGVSSFYVQPTYNYIALDWEAKLGALDELQSPLIYTEEGGKLSDRSFNAHMINRRFTRDVDRLNRLFLRRTNKEIAQHKNIMFGVDYEYKRSNHYKKNYPFYNRIVLNKQTNKDFKTRLKELGLYELLIEDYVQSTKESISYGDESYQTFNFNQWVNKSDFEIDDTNIKILSPSYTKPNNFFYNLKKLNMIGFTRQMIKTHQRTTYKILNNFDHYNEVMFYKFDKFDNRTNRLIQTFWLPAEDAIDFIDTQVLYGKSYRYDCTAHVLIIGTNYSITKDRDKIVSVIDPSLRIVEIPMFSDTCNIIQPPQPIPHIQIENDKLNRNHIEIFIKLNANYYNAEFIPLESTELVQNQLVSEYNKLKTRPYFHYETEHALFEIFRLDRMPESFDEIDNYKIGEIRHPIPSIATSFRDKISIGKKYYYVFRSINVHGLLSNPTAIYEVEMLEDADETFLKIQTVEIKPEEKYQTTRTLTKDLQILPSSLHTIFDQSKAPVSEGTLRNKITNLTLGIAEDRIWGKKFKFRITSKDTGKKIDINVDVKLTNNKTIEDFK